MKKTRQTRDMNPGFFIKKRDTKMLVLKTGSKNGSGRLTDREAELPRGRSQAGAWERVRVEFLSRSLGTCEIAKRSFEVDAPKLELGNEQAVINFD